MLRRSDGWYFGLAAGVFAAASVAAAAVTVLGLGRGVAGDLGYRHERNEAAIVVRA